MGYSWKHPVWRFIRKRGISLLDLGTGRPPFPIRLSGVTGKKMVYAISDDSQWLAFGNRVGTRLPLQPSYWPSADGDYQRTTACPQGPNYGDGIRTISRTASGRNRQRFRHKKTGQSGFRSDERRFGSRSLSGDSWRRKPDQSLESQTIKEQISGTIGQNLRQKTELPMSSNCRSGE